MVRIIVACALTAASTFALTMALLGHSMTAVAAGTESPGVVPPCPHPSYGANGNMGPLFCVIDNPMALRYFAPIAKHTFALGPDASPEDVTAALAADLKHGGTGPIICSIYQLASWRNHWHFGISPVDQLGFPPHSCQTPSFNDFQ